MPFPQLRITPFDGSGKGWQIAVQTPFTYTREPWQFGIQTPDWQLPMIEPDSEIISQIFPSSKPSQSEFDGGAAATKPKLMQKTESEIKWIISTRMNSTKIKIIVISQRVYAWIQE